MDADHSDPTGDDENDGEDGNHDDGDDYYRGDYATMMLLIVIERNTCWQSRVLPPSCCPAYPYQLSWTRGLGHEGNILQLAASRFQRLRIELGIIRSIQVPH